MAESRTTYYRRRARDGLRLLVDREYAASWPEVEAKIADQPLRGLDPGRRDLTIDPGHLSEARRQLTESDEMVYEPRTTRGGRSVSILRYADLSRRRRRTEDAAARKRLLTARYIGWTQASALFPHGRMGPAGEEVVHRSLREAAPAAGYQLLNPDRGQAHHALGHRIEQGPVDNAAFLHLTDDRGRPSGESVLTMLEVKNRRHWLYPQAEEIYQLLHKAAAMQEREPSYPILPVLVVRQHHYLTWTMARDLGVYLIKTRNQYMLPQGIDDESINEVKAELGLFFLTPTTAADQQLTGLFANSLPHWAAENARVWREVGSRFTEHYEVLRRSLSDDERNSAYYAFRDDAREEAGCSGPWTRARP